MSASLADLASAVLDLPPGIFIRAMEAVRDGYQRRNQITRRLLLFVCLPGVIYKNA